MRITDTSDLWWKSAVIYCLDVEKFMDWNGDGVGDFAGLAHRMDYLHELGVTCLWLMPFYPTPNRDDGYDVSDFFGIDPRLGDPGDLVEVIRTAASGSSSTSSSTTPRTSTRGSGRRDPTADRPTATTTCGATGRRAARPSPCSRMPRRACGSSTSGPASTTCTTSTGSSPT
jgi:hypothetical protein